MNSAEPVAPEKRPPPPDPPPAPARGRRTWLNVLLFALTFVSATWAYLRPDAQGAYFESLLAALADPERLQPALLFAGALMAILLAHEMGHWLTARRSGVDQSLP